jgi:hypothetical protein
MPLLAQSGLRRDSKAPTQAICLLTGYYSKCPVTHVLAQGALTVYWAGPVPHFDARLR